MKRNENSNRRAGPAEACDQKGTGAKAEFVESQNSGDLSGGVHRVASYRPGRTAACVGERYSAEERHCLLRLARLSLGSAVGDYPTPEFPESELSPNLLEKRSCFVTLTKAGRLRGCVGNMLATQSLYRAVMESARGAALRDTRFPPLRADELEEVQVEISVLSEPQPLSFASAEELLAKLRPFRDGVLLRIGMRTATFLPQVWYQVPDKREFMDRLAQKAGFAPGTWRGEGVTVSTYEAECFEE